jgi:hypothetical protein
MTWSDYKRQIRRLMTVYGIQGIIRGTVPLAIEDDANRQGGKILIEHPGIQFKDSSHLIARETVRRVGNSLVCEKYDYHYERPNGYFFRYDREPTIDPVRKPEFHLHVITNLPHYPSCAMTLEKILEFIKVNFYSPQHHRTPVGQEIHLVV